MESREKKLQLLHRQSGGGATSKKDRFDLAARDCLKAPMESGEQKFQLLHRKGGRGATSEKNCFNPAAGDLIETPIEIEQYCIQKSLCFVAVRGLFIKAAVRTNLRTKRNVDIEVMQFPGLLDSVLDLHKHDYNPASCSEL